MPRSSPPDLPIIGDELCEHILATPSQYDTTARALAREVLRLRALERSIRQLVEAADLDYPGAGVAAYSYLDSGKVAEILNRADRAK